jgi:large subunit ribosomal protein L21
MSEVTSTATKPTKVAKSEKSESAKVAKPSKSAVVLIAGKQWWVKEGDTLVVDRQDMTEGSDVEFSEVLLTIDDGKTNVGTPLVAKAVVKAKVASHMRGDKIRVATFKAKSRYRKVHGHRQDQTTLEITKIVA